MNQTLQQLIIADLNVKSLISPEEEYRTRVDALKGILKTSGRKGFALSIDAEQATALSAKIAQTAINELRAETGDLRYLFLALYLVDGQENMGEAREVFNVTKSFIGADSVIAQDISQSVLVTEKKYPTDNKEQLVTRVRTAITHGYAKERNHVVLATGNASEHVLGEATLCGDTVADVQPLAGLSRHQVNQILHFLNAPATLLTKVPTVSHSGISFNEVDKFLGGAETVKTHQIGYQFRATEQERRNFPGKKTQKFLNDIDEYMRLNGSRVLATV